MKVSGDGMLDGMFKSVSLGVLALSLTLFLGACGGGGGGGGGGAAGGGADPNPKLSGTVAEGAPIGSATITFLDESGNTTDVVTEADGSYSVDLKALGLSRPVMARVVYYDDVEGVKEMYSFAGSGDDVCNIHPFTDMIMRSWFEILAPAGVDSISDAFDSGASFDLPSETEVDIIKAVVTSVVNDILVAALGEEGAENFDLIETEFGVTGGGFDGVLDDTNVNVSETTGVLSVTVVPGSDLETAVESEGGSTSITMDTGDIDVEGTDNVAPEAITDLGVIEINGQLLMTWSVPDNDEGGVDPLTGLAGYNIYNNTTSIATVTSTMFILPSIPSSYIYTVKAFDAASPANESVASNTVIKGEATTPADVAPGAVVFGNVSSPSPSEVILPWTPIVDEDLSGYAIYRNITAIQPALPIANIPADNDIEKAAGTRIFVDLGLTHSTDYFYWVVTEDAAGNSSAAAGPKFITTLTPVVTTVLSEAPILSNVSALGAAEVKITWENYTSAGDLAGFYIYRNTSTVGVAPATATTYIDTNGLVADTTYDYEIAAFDPAGVATAADGPLSVTTQPLAAADVSYFLTQARLALENNNISAADGFYTDAVEADATNAEANFGLAVTELATLVEDPDLITFFDAYSAYAPTAERLIYGLFSSNYEVYGADVGPGTSYDCDEAGWDPVSNGYTKLGTATQFTSNQYYMIRTSPFNEVDLNISGDRIKVHCDSNFNTTYEQYTGFSGEVMQVNGNLGGTGIYNDFIIIEALYDNTINISSPGGATQQKASVATSEDGSTADHARMVLDKAKSVFGSLPKSEPSLLTKMKVAAKTMIGGPPDMSDLQAVANNAIIPALDSIISHLRVAQGKGLTFVVTPAMTGDATAEGVVFDDGEFYAIDALLSLVNSMMYGLTAYHLDGDFSIVEYDPLSLINGPAGVPSVDSQAFFTLQADGLTRMASARAGLQDFAAKAESAYTYVFNEWGYTAYVPNADDSYGYPCEDSVLKPTLNPGDNGVRLHDDFNGWDACNPYSFREEDDDIAKLIFDTVPMVLAGQITVSEVVTTGCNDSNTDCFDYSNEQDYPRTRKIKLTRGTQTVVLDREGTYDSVDSFSVNANITKIFTNPLEISDLPTADYDLPINSWYSETYGFSVYSALPGDDGIHNTYDANEETTDCEVYPTSDLPDYTFNGILPGGIESIEENFGGFESLNSAVLLEDLARPSSDWTPATSDGSIIYFYDSSAVVDRIVEVSGSSGAFVGETFMLQTSVNAVSYVEGLAYDGSELWAAGSFYNMSGVPQKGLFTIAQGEIAGTQIPVADPVTVSGCNSSTNDWCEQDVVSIRDVASDGTYLYATYEEGRQYCSGSWFTDHYEYYNCYMEYTSGAGVLKMLPTVTSIDTSSPFISMNNDDIYGVYYGGGSLWVNDGGLEYNLSGTLLYDYAIMDGSTFFHNGSHGNVREDRIRYFVKPGGPV